MGEILLKYYNFVKSKRGLPGEIELAKMTKVPSVDAAVKPDAEYIEVFKKAIKEITGEEPIIN